MSAGHHPHGRRHSPTLEREFKKLIAQTAVRKYLDRAFTVDYSFQIPLTGGSSKSGMTYYIDPDVPMKLRKFVLEHERYEKAFRDVLGMRYDRAHELATVGERLAVEAAKQNWNEYKRAIAKPVRLDERQGSNKLPSNFDYGPMRESGMLTNSTT